MRIVPFVFLAVVLAACDLAAQDTVTRDACGATARAGLIGMPGEALDGLSSQQGAVRLIRPGDAVTEDYSETRLNADLDEKGRIVRLWCG